MFFTADSAVFLIQGVVYFGVIQKRTHQPKEKRTIDQFFHHFTTFHKKYTFENLPFLYFALIGRLFVLFNAIFYESMRIAFYFDMFLIPYAASIYSCPIKRKFDRCVVSTIVILPSFLYWLYFIMYKGGYATNVFKFR